MTKQVSAAQLREDLRKIQKQKDAEIVRLQTKVNELEKRIEQKDKQVRKQKTSDTSAAQLRQDLRKVQEQKDLLYTEKENLNAEFLKLQESYDKINKENDTLKQELQKLQSELRKEQNKEPKIVKNETEENKQYWINRGFAQGKRFMERKLQELNALNRKSKEQVRQELAELRAKLKEKNINVD